MHRNKLIHLDLKSQVGAPIRCPYMADILLPPFLAIPGEWGVGDVCALKCVPCKSGERLNVCMADVAFSLPMVQNVLLTGDGHAKIADVGLSQVLSSTNAHVSKHSKCFWNLITS